MYTINWPSWPRPLTLCDFQLTSSDESHHHHQQHHHRRRQHHHLNQHCCCSADHSSDSVNLNQHCCCSGWPLFRLCKILRNDIFSYSSQLTSALSHCAALRFTFTNDYIRPLRVIVQLFFSRSQTITYGRRSFSLKWTVTGMDDSLGLPLHLVNPLTTFPFPGISSFPRQVMSLIVVVSWWSSSLLTVASSDDEAMTLSSNGFHLMSVTGPRCPHTRGMFTSTRPVCNVHNIHNIIYNCQMSLAISLWYHSQNVHRHANFLWRLDDFYGEWRAILI